MKSHYWENLQPFVEDERSAEPVEFDRLRTLFLAVQSALQEARRLSEQVATESKRLGLPDHHSDLATQ